MDAYAAMADILGKSSVFAQNIADFKVRPQQIAMAEGLAKRLGIDYPASHKKSMKKTSEFIDKHFKK